MRLPLALAAALAAAVGCGGGEERSGAAAAAPSEDPASAAAPSGPPPDPASYGSLEGGVFLDGPVPKNPEVSIAGAPTCAAQHAGGRVAREWYLVSDGRLQNCFVWIHTGLHPGLEWPVPAEPVELDQVGCVYRPHAQGLRAGQTLLLGSSDEEGHNVRAQSRRGQGFNLNMPPRQHGVERLFRRAEVPVLVTCSVHPWMEAWLGVFDHPFFTVTGPDGAFRWEGVPPGEYTLRAWHEKLGQQEARVTVPPSGAASVEFRFRSPEVGGPR